MFVFEEVLFLGVINIGILAGVATLEVLRRENPYEQLDAMGEKLFGGLADGTGKTGHSVSVNRVGSMGCAFFAKGPVGNYKEAVSSDTEIYARFHRLMLEKGVYLAPSQYEAAFVSAAHTGKDIDHILNAARESLAEIPRRGE